MNILVIEDDKTTAEDIRAGLAAKGHKVTVAGAGDEGLKLAQTAKHDVLVVDRMLPKLDGLSLVKQLRGSGHTMPVLLLTAIGGLDDRVEGLEAGADDYLTKPFAMAELLARLNALSRRPGNGAQTTLRHGAVEMDLLKREVRRDGKLVDLQPQEFKLLEYLLRSEGRIVTKAMLLQHVWNFSFDPQTTVVETHMSRLRAKLDYGFSRPAIVTQRGLGYRLVG